jgi:hypothetical protein
MVRGGMEIWKSSKCGHSREGACRAYGCLGGG